MKVYLEQLARNVRFADVLDVGVIATLLYCGLAWFRWRASRSLVVGLVLIAAVYVCARWLEMYLTSMLFQVGLMVALVALVVVFQQDIRRAFERLAAPGWLRWHRPSGLPSAVVDTLVESVATMAERRTGALIVFEGREPLDRHLRGGVPVDGYVSLPLLYSIFNPDSPGHDGAILIAGERIDKLGVHLPLSTNLTQIGEGGTRHSAALGLAECSDALIIVVSEERGTISVATEGNLDQVEPAKLASVLERYYQARFAPKTIAERRRVLTRNAGLKLIALSLACALWFVFAYRVETIQRTLVVPIEYRNLPETWAIDEPHPTRANITLSGSERAFNLLDPSEVAVSFDLGDIRSGVPAWLETEDSLTGVPGELTATNIQPRSVRITATRSSGNGATGPES